MLPADKHIKHKVQTAGRPRIVSAIGATYLLITLKYCT